MGEGLEGIVRRHQSVDDYDGSSGVGKHRKSSVDAANGFDGAEVGGSGDRWRSVQEFAGGGAVPQARGFDNSRNVVMVVALAVVITIRPRALFFLRLLPFLLPLFLFSVHLASRSTSGVRSVRMSFPIVVLVAYFVTTTEWSGALMLSVAESLAIFCIAGTAMILASFCSLREFVAGVMFGCLAALAVSAALGVGLPGYGLVPGGYEAGSLKGVMTDRNSLSFVLLIGLIATVSYEFRGRWARVYKCTLCLLFFAGVLWTRSSTCLVLSVLTVALAAELALLRTVVQAWRGWAIAGGAIATCIAGFYINSHFDQVLRLVERDATFSGRTAVWPAVKNLIAKDPWLGQGWGGVWGNEPVRQELARAIGFEVPHAHNGYLDVQLQVGEVGLILVFVVLFLIAVRGVLCFLRTNSSLSSWAIILMLVLLFYNRVETSFSAPFTMFLMFATLVTLDKLTCRSPLACANGESIF